MFELPWADRAAAVVFAVVAVLVLVRLVLSRRGVGRAGLVAEVVMAAGMAAMAMPSGGPVPRGVWLVAFGAGAGWFALVLVRLGPASGPAGLSMGPTAWRRAAGPAAHHLVASTFMLFAYGVGHGRHTSHEIVAVDLDAGSRSGSEHAVHGGHPGAGLAGPGAGLAGSADRPLPTPVGVLLGLGFLLWATWWTVHLIRGSDAPSGAATALARTSGLPERGRLVTVMRSVLLGRVLSSSCSILMGVGMAAMAFAMS
ncbi:MAG: DUF5134 domain-containing protein [Actinomycetota bacterium]|nr:DUF5134 domain-containing protein [Actinomycetota bacterium]